MTRKEKIEAAFKTVEADPKYHFGVTPWHAIRYLESKLFVIRMYEKATGKKILDGRII